MSDVSQGPGWWLASDGKWYPPEAQPGPAPTAPAASSDAMTTTAVGGAGAAAATDVGDRTSTFQVTPEQVMPSEPSTEAPAEQWTPGPVGPAEPTVAAGAAAADPALVAHADATAAPAAGTMVAPADGALAAVPEPAPVGVQPGLALSSVEAPGALRRRKSIGAWTIVLGVAVFVWGVGYLLVAVHAFDKSENVATLVKAGNMLEAVGLMITGLIVLVIGSLYRSD
ncbi:MAG TPA: hypothetical protein VKG43_12165 [Acidimicrobiales bacterium]|nr:hypothetical protein [Acidimicrobiales bacterium]